MLAVTFPPRPPCWVKPNSCAFKTLTSLRLEAELPGRGPAVAAECSSAVKLSLSVEYVRLWSQITYYGPRKGPGFSGLILHPCGLVRTELFSSQAAQTHLPASADCSGSLRFPSGPRMSAQGRGGSHSCALAGGASNPVLQMHPAKCLMWAGGKT